MSDDRKHKKTQAPRSEGLAFSIIGLVTALVIVLIASAVYPRLPGARPANSSRVEAAKVAPAVATAELQVIDARAAARYNAGHLPGAVSIPAQSLRDTAFGNLASPAELAEILDQRGVEPNRSVLVYADQLAEAAYVAWALVSLGHTRVNVLDGGIAAWVANGGALETTPNATVRAGSAGGRAAAGLWVARALERWPTDRYLDLFDLYAVLNDAGIALVDTRESSGREAAIAGGATPDVINHVDWKALVSEDGRSFKNRMALHRALQVLPARKQLVVYGDDTLASAVVWWSLYEHGYAQVARFDEPFSVWADMGFPTRKVEAPGASDGGARLGGGCG